MKLAVMGAGSLGIVVGALIAKSGQDVVLIDIDERNVEALNSKGARIAGSLDITVPLRAILPSQMAGPYDVVFLLTKQTYNEAALTALAASSRAREHRLHPAKRHSRRLCRFLCRDRSHRSAEPWASERPGASRGSRY